MTIGSTVRRRGFWLVDRMRGSAIAREYDDIHAKMSNGRGTGEQLEQLLDLATSTTPFYEPYAGKDLGAFPVIGKADIKRDHGAFRSSAYAGTALHQKTTSGSTGTPFSVGQDPRKRARSIADTIYFNELAGHRVGDRLLWLQSWRMDPRPRLEQIKQNVIPIDVVGLDDDTRERVVRVLRDGQVSGVLSFASVLWSIARYIERKGYSADEFGLNVVISGAETLPLPMKRRMEAAFGCPVVDRYANEENGILATTMINDDRHVLNRASFHFELLKIDEDTPASPGERARVVVTDLYSFALPMIRYDTGDVAIASDHGGHAAEALDAIDGRLVDVGYDTQGRQFSAPTVSTLMSENFVDLAQYRLEQDDATSYRLRVALGGASHSDAELTDALRLILGADALIEVEHVDEIPSEANGKYRSFVSHYDPSGG